MIRDLPVDPARMALVSAGAVEPVFAWIEKDGRRQPATDQERDEATGMPLWSVHCLTAGADRPEVVAVRVPSRECPAPEAFAPVAFERLRVRINVNRTSGALTGYWAADGIGDPRRHGQQHKQGEQQAA